MHPTKLWPTCFFQVYSGRLKVILTRVFSGVWRRKWNFGFETQVNLSGVFSYSLSYKWHPPALLSVHSDDKTAFLESSSFSISTGLLEKTIRILTVTRLTCENVVSERLIVSHLRDYDERTLSRLVKGIQSSHVFSFEVTLVIPLIQQKLQLPFKILKLGRL